MIRDIPCIVLSFRNLSDNNKRPLRNGNTVFFILSNGSCLTGSSGYCINVTFIQIGGPGGGEGGRWKHFLH